MLSLPQRTAPHNLEAEQAVLAAMLGDDTALRKCRDQLTPHDFYKESHQLIADALYRNGNDLVALIELLKKEGSLEKVGGQEYFFTLAEASLGTAGLSTWIQIIKEASLARAVMALCANTVNACYGPTPIEDTLSGLKSALLGLQQHGARTDHVDAMHLARAWYDQFWDRIETKGNAIGPTCGYPGIDDKIQGFAPSTLTYLASRPSVGKTALLLQFCKHIASTSDKPVLFFSLEMSTWALLARLISSMTGIFLARIRSGQVHEDQHPLILNTLGKLQDLRLRLYDETKYCNIEHLCNKAMDDAMDAGGVAAVLVDHIQLMSASKRTQSRHHEISYISRSLKLLAKDLQAPVIVACQLRRPQQGEHDKPKLTSLKESGDLEQDADIVLMLYRLTLDHPLLEVLCEKGRDIGIFRTFLKFDGRTQTIATLSDEEAEIYQQPDRKGL